MQSPSDQRSSAHQIKFLISHAWIAANQHPSTALSGLSIRRFDYSMRPDGVESVSRSSRCPASAPMCVCSLEVFIADMLAHAGEDWGGKKESWLAPVLFSRLLQWYLR